MAGALYRSSANNNSTGTSIAITKPTGLAEGDLMIAQIASDSAGAGSPTLTPPSGWAVEDTEDLGSYFRATVYSKIANSTDAAASTFTFTTDGRSIIGGITVIQNPDPTLGVDQINSNGGLSGDAISTSGITPTRADATVLIMVAWMDALNATYSVSGYSVATTNPSWTEIYDIRVTDTDTIGISAAYGYRGALTATGNASATISTSVDRAYAIFVLDVIPPALVTPSVTTTAIPGILRKVLTMASAIATCIPGTVSTVTRVWSNVSKNSATWTNQDKS